MFVCKAKEGKPSAGSMTLLMRLPSFRQALDFGHLTVWADSATGQSASRLCLSASHQVAAAFPVKRKILLNPRFPGFEHTRACYAHQ